MRKTSPTIARRPTTPPATPPAIAPTFEPPPLSVRTGALDAVGLGAGVGVCMMVRMTVTPPLSVTISIDVEGWGVELAPLLDGVFEGRTLDRVSTCGHKSEYAD